MMMNKYPKRLIEVDLPIKRISAHARREKDMRLSHIPQLHIYPAARPLAACRAVLCASLWPDPVDELCPDKFRQKAKELMLQWAKNNLSLLSNDSLPNFIEYQKNPNKLNDNIELRKALLDFIADFANWDNSTSKDYIETIRKLTHTAHEALGGEKGTKPLVVGDCQESFALFFIVLSMVMVVFCLPPHGVDFFIGLSGNSCQLF
jgi:hypothetical protein